MVVKISDYNLCNMLNQIDALQKTPKVSTSIHKKVKQSLSFKVKILAGKDIHTKWVDVERGNSTVTRKKHFSNGDAGQEITVTNATFYARGQGKTFLHFVFSNGQSVGEKHQFWYHLVSKKVIWENPEGKRVGRE